HGDVSSRMSPLASCDFAAVSGCTSTHPCQVILDTGSGSSWSHGLFAPRPSCRAIDGKTISTYFSDTPPVPVRPPSCCAIPGTSRTLCTGASLHSTMLNGVAPEVGELPAAAVPLMQHPPPGLHVLLEGARSTGGLEQHVAGVAG